MKQSESAVVRATLEKPDVHEQWIGDFYSTASRRFYDAAFDRIVGWFASREKSSFLDAGCGDGSHTVRLARRGYPVVAIDFSEHILAKAREVVAFNELAHQVRFEHGSLLDLPVADDSFEYVLCWGVLMHIPDVEVAISQLARVVKPSGYLIISENNMWSLDSILERTVRRLLGSGLLKRLLSKEPVQFRTTPAGVEYWRQSDAGPIFCRDVRVSWLVATFARHGLVLTRRTAGEFTALHTVMPAKILKRALWAFNLMWFNYVRWALPATGNILLFQKIRR
jgi:2-polyprenyl-3-methyl-5-hydroxy-6-metoxy-1,4-benzoquinol methylase